MEKKGFREKMYLKNVKKDFKTVEDMKVYQEPKITIIIIKEQDIITSSGPEGYIEFWGENNEE